MDDLIFLIQSFLVLFVPVVVWRGFRMRGMVPLVVVQILVGIALGPSLFGRIAPETFHRIFNPGTLSPLWGVASLAVLLFGFVTGLHLDSAAFVGRGRSFSLIASASVGLPTLAGFFGGLWIAARYPDYVGIGVDRVEFAVAIGLCVGVTALPVLGALLYEMDLLGQRIGDLALGIAAVNDASLWILLGGLMTALAANDSGSRQLVVTLLGLPVYILIMTRLVRPLLTRARRYLLEDGTLSVRALAGMCAIALGSAIASQLLGLHYIFGAFVAGALMPHEFRKPILDRLQLVTIAVLMPFFFMLTGLRTLIDFGSAGFVETLLVTTGLAVLGKVGGTTVVARLVGEPWSEALSLGALVQTKGLMELIVLTILLDRGVIAAPLFSALVLMAVLTTMLAMPLVWLALRLKGRAAQVAAAPVRTSADLP
jgi:Kef-type K+ transport system membrane component KefB